MDPDAAIRASAFAALGEIEQRYGSVVPAGAIRAGFVHRGELIPFRSQQGIFRPRQMRGGALSISTVVPSSGPPRYDDEVGSDEGAFTYRYRDNGPQSHDNRILRAAFEMQVPIIYFRGVAPSLYAPLWPCFVTADDPAAGAVQVEIGIAAVDLAGTSGPLSQPIERRYVMRLVKQRLHQNRFRAAVLRAYRERCTVCRLREPALLEASHILPDRDRRGEASVPNGLSLCSIHHDAYDRDLIAVTPDYRVRVGRRLLEDDDGPMLEWGLKSFHEAAIHLPRRPGDHPSREFLEERLGRFERAA